MFKNLILKMVMLFSIAPFMVGTATSKQGGFAKADRKTSSEIYRPYLEKLEAELGVPTSLSLGVMKTESNFDSSAVSSAGALGLMQLMPATALGVYTKTNPHPTDIDLFNRQLLAQPDLNMKLGVSYLAHLDEVYKKVTRDNRRRQLVLASYNGGFVNLIKAFECKRIVCVVYKAQRVHNSRFTKFMSKLPKETRDYLVKVPANTHFYMNG